jgi:anti-sigma regulatory factor (Ser/Thr protein kinase)
MSEVPSQVAPEGVAESLTLAVEASPESLSSVRRSVASWIELLGVGPDEAGAVLVVVSELMANSVEACEPDDEISVCLSAEGETVAVEVSNPSRRTSPVRIPSMADPLASRGRGLAIVEALTDDISLCEVDGATVARAELRLAHL